MNHSRVCSFWMRTLGCSLGVVLMVLAIPVVGVQAQQPTASKESVANGKRNLVTYVCSACHGYSGQGTDRGPRLDANRLSFAAFERIVRQGGNVMPRFGTQAQLPDSALADIYAFLKSVPVPPEPKSIPLLNYPD